MACKTLGDPPRVFCWAEGFLLVGVAARLLSTLDSPGQDLCAGPYLPIEGIQAVGLAFARGLRPSVHAGIPIPWTWQRCAPV